MTTDDWKVVDVDRDLSDRNLKLYLAAKAQYRQYKAAKEEFEQAMQKDFAEKIPNGQELKFGYNFGKLSLAIGEARKAKAKTGKPQGSLVDWLSAQSNGGYAS